ncbi:hypothetical protein F444_20026 [Phytophthora nicotianae P1976]|uniref:Ankyrin repeat-containing domain n=1 Tax=Phytophthora nicotianae P1976 TaxID=1317066 RepID=A0A080Z5W8_PHYNI|nr:hypothetical protein F444_20026 [Phytophthora nicotianae P1976]
MSPLLQRRDSLREPRSVVLQCVEVVLRHNDALQHTGGIISSFLGPPPNLPLAEACSYGSIDLLDWIWESSCTSAEDRSSSWTLCNYLRSDTHYVQWQFAEALEVAGTRNDVTVVEWLLEHNNGSQISEYIVDAVVAKGHLDVLKIFLAYQIEAGMVDWGYSIVTAMENGHSEVVRWMHKNIGGGVHVHNLIAMALDIGDMDLAQFLMPRGGCLLDYACPGKNVYMIEWMFDCGYLRRSETHTVSAIQSLAEVGNLELLQKVIQLVPELPIDSSIWIRCWGFALKIAFMRCNFPTIRCLVEHRMGYLICNCYCKVLADLTWLAARKGHIELLQYVYNLGIPNAFKDVSIWVGAVSNGKLETVKWLLERKLYPPSDEESNVIDEAAKYGRLEILQFFHGLNTVMTMDEDAPESRLTIQVNKLWAKSHAIDLAAAHGHLAVIQWLHMHRKEGCTANAMDGAATYGHLHVVQWLQENRDEGCTTVAMDAAASNGHMSILQYLQINRSEGCSASIMDGPAKKGDLNMLKWLHENRADWCTNWILKYAVYSGHLGTICWLLVHYPGLKLESVEMAEDAPNKFDVVLLLVWHFGQSWITSDFVEESILPGDAKPHDNYIAEWVREKM